MDPDEIVYNEFYHSLRNEYRKKYEYAISKCWTICVPSGNSLRGLLITDKFVDDHILKPHPELRHHFSSIGADDPSIYKFNGKSFELVITEDGESGAKNDANYEVKIASVERGYNMEFQTYLIVVLQKPIHPKYELPKKLDDEERKLNRSVTCYKEAVSFFGQFDERAKSPLEKLESTLRNINLEDFKTSEDLCSELQDLTRHYWAIIMRKHCLYLQRDARLQKLLTTSLEVFIMHFLHDKIYCLLSGALEREDLYLSEKIGELIDADVTPDQLGADESLAIALPAAVVELATLDAREGPLEKFLCLRSTMDLIVAEVKAALAEVETETEENAESAAPSPPRTPCSDDLVPLLVYVIVKSRPRRLVSDLHYVKNFLWSVSPHEGLAYCLETFEAAVSTLFQIKVLDLPDRSNKVKTALPIGELFEVIARSEEDVTPLDRQIHRLATMLEKCTQD